MCCWRSQLWTRRLRKLPSCKQHVSTRGGTTHKLAHLVPVDGCDGKGQVGDKVGEAGLNRFGRPVLYGVAAGVLGKRVVAEKRVAKVAIVLDVLGHVHDVNLKDLAGDVSNNFVASILGSCWSVEGVDGLTGQVLLALVECNVSVTHGMCLSV